MDRMIVILLLAFLPGCCDCRCVAIAPDRVASPAVATSRPAAAASGLPGSANRAARPQGPRDAAEAVAAFQAEALAALAAHTPADADARSMQDYAAKRIRDTARLNARLSTLDAGIKIIESSLRPEEQRTCILVGSLDDLRGRSDACWKIESFGTFSSEIEGYIDAHTGQLVLLWVEPEG